MVYEPVSRSGADDDPDIAVVPLPSGGILAGERPDKDPWAEGQHAPAVGPWRLAGKRLRRNTTALIFLGPVGQVRRVFDLVGVPSGVTVLDPTDLHDHEGARAA